MIFFECTCMHTQTHTIWSLITGVTGVCQLPCLLNGCWHPNTGPHRCSLNYSWLLSHLSSLPAESSLFVGNASVDSSSGRHLVQHVGTNTETHSCAMYREWKVLDHPVLDKMSSSNSSPQGSDEEEAERLWEPDGMDDSKGTVYSRHSRIGVHKNSHRLRSNARTGPAQVQVGQGLSAGRGKWTPALPLASTHKRKIGLFQVLPGI